MKKVLTLVAGLMMLSASAETVTLYDGNEWSGLVPFNGMYLDTPGNKTQVLYPAADLTAMVGKEIKGITFYSDAEGCSFTDGTVNISLGETTAEVMNGYITEGMTQVGTFTFSMFSGYGEFTITFDEPYLYQGGHLVFEDVVAEASSRFDYIYCLGVSTTYNNCYVTSYSPGPRQFLPKTTFTYGDDTPEPQVLRGDVDENGEVGISDVTALIDMLLAGVEAPAVADADRDGVVAIGDVTAIIDYLLTTEWPN